MRPFWIHSGLSLLDVDAHGGLIVTDAFLRAYLERPELAPIEETCLHERALHERLLREPRSEVPAGELEQIADADSAENWRLFLRFRDRLIAAPSVQAAYYTLFADAAAAGRVDVPPLLVDQLAQIIVHHLLADCEDGLTLRVAELWFREQRVSLDEGRVVLADSETVEERIEGAPLGDLGRLLARGGVASAGVELETIDAAGADKYFGRDERHDLAVEITHGREAASRLADLLALWIGHLIGLRVRVRTLASIDDARWSWHVGLDPQASTLLDKLYAGDTLTPDEHRRILLLMRLDFERVEEQDPSVAGKPVYMALACDHDRVLRFKPQNLLFNLPVARQ
ncbi:MAG TPA: DUF6352 family protein [Burkholderiaceae bacterium]